MPAFLANEDFIHLNLVDYARINRERLCGIYGDEDGFFTPLELGVIQKALDDAGHPSRFRLLKNASHGLFMDQQDDFLAALQTTCGLK